uniref:Sulfotransferase n=1 Tax=Lates calcarifer TaxID=8187 RepID=A0A4W6ESB1_LATCA
NHLSHVESPFTMDLSPHLELFDFHGVSMTHYFTENWENIQTFQVRPDDILLATYPKAGLSTNLSKVWHQIIIVFPLCLLPSCSTQHSTSVE